MAHRASAGNGNENGLRFVHLSTFERDWRDLRLDDADLRALELCILARPESGVVVAGTGGLRKLRFAPPSWSRGKRGAVRVCYAYFPTHGTVVLIVAYAKNVKDDLSEQEKRTIRQLLQRFESWLDRQV